MWIQQGVFTECHKILSDISRKALFCVSINHYCSPECLHETFTFSTLNGRISKGSEKRALGMISYEGLYEQLRKKGITKTDLTLGVGISSRTITKIARGGKLSNKTLEKIAAYLNCTVETLFRENPTMNSFSY